MRTESSKIVPKKSKNFPAPEVLTAYSNLHAVAPELFPTWGARFKPDMAFCPVWSGLGHKISWRAMNTAVHLVYVVGLEWSYDSKSGDVTVYDETSSATVNDHSDIRVALMQALHKILQGRPELAEPRSWEEYDTPHHPVAPVLEVEA